MAWNEPGGGDRDPWGKRDNEGPPDLDELLKKLKIAINDFLGGNKNGKSSGSGDDGKTPELGLFPLYMFIAVFFLVWVSQSFYALDEKERGVVLRFGQFNRVLEPGLKFAPWLIDSVERELVTEEKQYTASGKNSRMLTKDENIVQVPLTVQYNIADVRAYVLNVNQPIQTLEQATDSAIRHVVGSTNLDAVLGEGRQKMADEVEARLQTYLDSYGTGINVIDVTLQRAEPPDEVRTAFDDVNSAEQDQERLINQAEAYRNAVLPKARGEAQKIIEESNAYSGQLVARAEGEASRFVQLLTEYQRAPEVTRERLYIDAIQTVMTNSSKVMVDVEGGNNMMYLPLDKLGGSRATEEERANVRSVVEDVIRDIQRANASGAR